MQGAALSLAAECPIDFSANLPRSDTTDDELLGEVVCKFPFGPFMWCSTSSHLSWRQQCMQQNITNRPRKVSQVLAFQLQCLLHAGI